MSTSVEFFSVSRIASALVFSSARTLFSLSRTWMADRLVAFSVVSCFSALSFNRNAYSNYFW